MAIHNDILRITDVETAWQDKTGLQVEDFICQSISDLYDNDIVDGSYDGTTLTLNRKSNNDPITVDVSVAELIYSHSLIIEHILIDGVKVTGDLIQCKLGLKIELGVIYKLTSENTITGKINHITSPQKLSVKVGNKPYIKIDTGIISAEEIQYVDITKYFTETTIGVVNLQASTTISKVDEVDKIVTASSNEILVLNPTLKYTGNNYIVNGNVSLLILYGGDANYILYYSVNGGNINSSNNLNIELSEPGVNFIKAYAQVSNDSSIKTKQIEFSVINVSENLDGIFGVVNEISDYITNWEYSKLYRLSLYTSNYSEDNVTIISKLTNTADANDAYLNKIKTINIEEFDNNVYQEDICYFFGIPDINSTFSSNLIVSLNGIDIVKHSDLIQIDILADSTFGYTSGSIYSFDLFNPESSNIITLNVLNNIESPDGLVPEEQLVTFKVQAKDYVEPVLKQDLSAALTNSGFTFELDFKSYNISSNDPLLKLGKFILYPTELNWQFSKDEEENEEIDTTSRSSLFLENVRTHLLIEVVPMFKSPDREIPNPIKSLKDKTTNLVRIFINGVIDREFTYTDLSDFYLNGFNLEIAPSSSDLNIYTLRVYNKALSLTEVVNNYISTLSDINEKIFLLNSNDIVSFDENNDSYISYNKTKQLYNTLLYILPKGQNYLNQFTASKDTEILDCTVFVNYVNNKKLPYTYTNEAINKCSGRFTGVTLKGLGTSAMKYYWYNISMKGKFTSNDCYDSTTQNYIEDKGTLYNSSTYYMPTDSTIGIKKLVGKTNYASSMQSHKIGATRAFHDLWKACVNTTSWNSLDLKGRKAILEEPFLVFYIESDIESTYNENSNPDATNSPMKNITIDYLNNLNDSSIKFGGFLTWGSGKGDKATSGYDDDTPAYLMLEGAENNGKLANFLMPWSPNCIVLDDETFKTLEEIEDENGNTIYSKNDDFDVNFGLKDDNNNSLNEYASLTMTKFTEAYNFCYLHTINLEPYTKTTSLNNDSTLDITKKYYITSVLYKDSAGFPGSQWDVFRYDNYSRMWVPAGLPKLDEQGNQVFHNTITNKVGTRVYDYDVFNLKTFCNQIQNTSENIENYKNTLISDFKDKFGTYFYDEDIIFHQAFIKLFVGTDNRAKNIYFKLVNDSSKIQLLQDDLDTILATDNRGLLKKPYFLLEPSLESDEYKGVWGGNSAFFELIDIAYKNEITSMLKNILAKFGVVQESSIHNWMQNYFYYVLEYFPAQAYNHTARLCYEDALIFYENLQLVDVVWGNNGYLPISQSHGSCLLSEKEFMKKRLIMFLSQVGLSNIFNGDAMGINIKSSEDKDSSYAANYSVKIVPYLDLYLRYNVGSTSNLYSDFRQKSNIETSITIDINSTTPLYSVLGSNYISKFIDFSNIILKGGNYNLTSKRLLEMSARSDKDSVTFLPSTITLSTPVLTKLDLTNIYSLSTIDLGSDKTPKLEEVYLQGTSITNVTLPKGSRLTTIEFPATLTDLQILDNPGLTNVTFESYENIETVYINCDRCGNFDVADFCERIKNSPLKSVTLKNLNNIKITEEAFTHLIINTEFNITGKVTLIENDGSEKDISFETKKMLVDNFGNILTGSKGLIIIYKESDITIEYPESAEAYYKGETTVVTNPFNLTITGNKVNIIEHPDDNSKYILDIKYELNSGHDSNVSIDKISGDITIKAQPTTATTAKIIINSYNYNTKGIEINFEWKAPRIGLFVYDDGTFSSNYSKSKKLLGLIYDKTGTENEGTLFVIGCERWNDSAYPSHVSNDYISASENVLHKSVQSFVSYFTTNFNSSLTPEGLTTYTSLVDKINYNSTIQGNSGGKADTELYVNFVNTYVLVKLYAKEQFNKYITRTDTPSGVKYHIDSLENLNLLCEALNSIQLVTGVSDEEAWILNSSMLFPYFYGAWLYKASNEDLQWYAPSYLDLAKIIYQYGYSQKLTSFNENNHNIVFDSYTQPKDDLTLFNNDDFKTTPVFALAYSKMGATNFCWGNLLGVNKSLIYSSIDEEMPITTTLNLTLAYGYAPVNRYLNSDSSWIVTGEWEAGIYSNSIYGLTGEGGTRNDTRLWAYTRRKGFYPITTISYKNPDL